MVIDDLNVIGIAAFPDEADAPLLVDPDAVLSFAVMMQRLQVVGRRDAQGLKEARGIQHHELDRRCSLNGLRQLAGKAPKEEFLGLFAFERLDHRNIVSNKDIIVKGYEEKMVLSSPFAKGDPNSGPKGARGIFCRQTPCRRRHAVLVFAHYFSQ